MSYTTVTNVAAMFPTFTRNGPKGPSDTLIQTFIDDVGAEIDAVLQRRFQEAFSAQGFTAWQGSFSTDQLDLLEKINRYGACSQLAEVFETAASPRPPAWPRASKTNSRKPSTNSTRAMRTASRSSKAATTTICLIPSPKWKRLGRSWAAWREAIRNLLKRRARVARMYSKNGTDGSFEVRDLRFDLFFAVQGKRQNAKGKARR
jgi:hypothetical protein